MADQVQIQTMNLDHEEPMAGIMPSVLTAMSYLLQRVSESNDKLSQKKQRISGFHGLTKPSISIRSYLERIFEYANCSYSCYIVAYIYLDRLVKKQPFLPINSHNVHRLIITSVLVSAKFMDDLSYNNGYYAKVGGISREEMNMLELDFLFGIEFQLNVTVSTFNNYCGFLQNEMVMLMKMESLFLKPSLSFRGSFKTKLLMNPHEEDSLSTHHNKKQQLAAA
ncbi:PREDICTED: cyclin-U4-3-like [Camelina sativa]|uniref:Cyclin n=1 Tax=Camelina sativa TaxID=90675 RepID=A0ABM0UP33_CAMSA|nr:PREDICTED: cyclin-U4-3-like [Camelina sativa]